MRKSLQTLGLSLFIVVALIIIGIGLLPGMNAWISVVMAAILLAIPLLNKWLTSKRFVAWRDDLSVGIGSIDDDHKKLLTLINNLQTAVYYPTGEAFERQALQELVDYTKYHFDREEKLMRDNGYADYEAHKRQHEAMIAKVSGFLDAYEKDREGTVEELSVFLKDWLLKHIAGTDQQYSSHLRSRGVT
ncbi:MAG: bacteriohemerythrin [Gammaproteobacteria bacterium]|nr:bacteriohemerythrin [Gammaproteobacteria bacterium]MCB1926004.1 bacteriohemerythrin [Gammaproteobacteria bacterium]